MKTVVFGGAGFLGSHVSDALSKQGHDVTIFDLRESPYLRADQTMVIGDIMDTDAVNAVCVGADHVYNFAGIADLDDARTKPAETARLNVIGNINVMEGACAAAVKRFVYASTIYVYSQKGGFYRCSKQASEVYVEEYGRKYDLPFTILRYGTLYGPRADASNSIFRYLKAGMETGRIEVNGTGDEIREYINVQDAAALSVQVLDEAYRDGHVILTGQHPTKFKEMLFIIREILNRPQIEIAFERTENQDHYAYTPYSFTPSIGRKLVSNPYTDLGQGLLECLDDMYGAGMHPSADSPEDGGSR